MTDQHKLWIAFRQALLMALDAIENYLGISPTTAEIRRLYKDKKMV